VKGQIEKGPGLPAWHEGTGLGDHVFPTRFYVCGFPQSVFRLWVKRLGQTRTARCNSLLHGIGKDDIYAVPDMSTEVAHGADPQAPEGQEMRRASRL